MFDETDDLLPRRPVTKSATKMSYERDILNAGEYSRQKGPKAAVSHGHGIQ